MAAELIASAAVHTAPNEAICAATYMADTAVLRPILPTIMPKTWR